MLRNLIIYVQYTLASPPSTVNNCSDQRWMRMHPPFLDSQLQRCAPLVSLDQHRKLSSLICTGWEISDHGEENEHCPLLCLGKPIFLKICSDLVCCSVKKENLPLIDLEIQSKLVAPKIASFDRLRNLVKNGSPKNPHLCQNSPTGMKCHEESLLFFSLCFCYLFFFLCFLFIFFL